MQLFITSQSSETDYTQVVIKEGTSFKYTINATLFSSSGEQSFEVVLPLDGVKTNIELFSSLHFKQTELAGTNGGRFILQLLNQTIYGRYTITSYNEKEVKVKLSACETRFLKDGGDSVYIDEMGLGPFFLEEWETLSRQTELEGEPCTPVNVKTALNRLSIKDQADGGERTSVIAYGGHYENKPGYTYEYKSAYAFRVKDDEGAGANDYQSSVYPVHYNTGQSYVNHPFFSDEYRFAFQPRLLTVVARVFKKIGYTFFEDNLNDIDKGHIIVTNICSYNFSEVLPHWTVEEFLSEVQQFLCGGFVFDEKDKTVRLIRVNNIIQNQPKEIIAFDEFDSDINEEAEPKGTTLDGNIDYDFPSIPKPLHLPEGLFEDFSVVFTDSKPASSITPNTIFTSLSQSKSWIYDPTSKGVIELDQYAPLQRTTDRKAKKKLRIMPARQVIEEHTNTTRTNENGGKSFIPVLITSSNIVQYNSGDLVATIKGGEDADRTSKPEVIEVANLVGGNVYLIKQLFNEQLPLMQPVPVAMNFMVKGDGLTPVPTLTELQTRLYEGSSTTDHDKKISVITNKSVIGSVMNQFSDGYLSIYRLLHYFNKMTGTYYNQVQVDTSVCYEMDVLLDRFTNLDINTPLLISGVTFIPLSISYNFTPGKDPVKATVKLYKLK